MLVLPRLPSSFEKGKNVGFLFSYSKWKMLDNLPTELLSPEVAEKGVLHLVHAERSKCVSQSS